MTLEVYENGLVVRFVQGKDIIDAYNTDNKAPQLTESHKYWKPLQDSRTLRRSNLDLVDFHKIKTCIECIRNFLRAALHFTKDNSTNISGENEYWKDTIPDIAQHYIEKTSQLLQRQETSCNPTNNNFKILTWDDPAPAYLMRMHHYWSQLNIRSYHSMHRSRNLYIWVDSTAKLMYSDSRKAQNAWWNNKLKAIRHKLTYLLPYNQIVFIILGGKDLPELMTVLLDFIQKDPIAQGDPSKFYHDVLFFLQFNMACYKPEGSGRNCKQIQGWTEKLRAEYAKHTPIIEQLHSCAVAGMGVTESWSNPKRYDVSPSQCKTPTWMEAVLNPAIEILRKTNKPLLNLRKFFMEMKPASPSDKWHYADTPENVISWFTTFAICAHFC